jgi:hypothetical protein
MSVVLIAIGLLFFLNPCVWLWDVLPDFIGAFIIMLGMKKIIFLSDETEDVYKCLWVVVTISAAKSVLSVFISDNVGFRLLAAVVFAILEGIFLTIAVCRTVKCLNGIEYRFCDPNVPLPDSRFPALEKVLRVYTIFRIVVGFLPEFSLLSDIGKFGDVVSDGSYDPVDSKWSLYLMALLITTVFLVVVLVMFFSAFSKYNKDKETPRAAVAAAEEVKAADISVWYGKKWRILRIPFTVCAVLSIFFFVDNVDYLPKALAATLLCILTFMSASNIAQRVIAVVANAALAVSSVIVSLRLSDFFENYGDEFRSIWDTEARKDYFIITILFIIQALLLFASFMLMTEVVKKTRLRQLSECGVPEKNVKRLKRQILRVRITSVAALLAAAAYPIFRPDFPGVIAILVLAGVVNAIFAFNVELEA